MSKEPVYLVCLLSRQALVVVVAVAVAVILAVDCCVTEKYKVKQLNNNDSLTTKILALKR